MRSMRFLFPVIVLILAASAHAQGRAGSGATVRNAVECIRLSVTADRTSRTMTNACNRVVGVSWCYDSGGKIGGCTTMNPGFYTSAGAVNPGEAATTYSPPNARIYYAACFDNEFYIHETDRAGGYRCDYPQSQGAPSATSSSSSPSPSGGRTESSGCDYIDARRGPQC